MIKRGVGGGGGSNSLSDKEGCRTWIPLVEGLGSAASTEPVQQRDITGEVVSMVMSSAFSTFVH